MTYLRLDVVGVFTVRRDGHELTPGEVGSRKARTLLALLAVEHRNALAVGRIADVLWGDDRPPRRPERDIATLVSRLRATLGPSVVSGGRSGYRLGEQVRVDLYEAASATPRQALPLLERGGVLDDLPEAGWADPARSVHSRLLRKVRHQVAESALSTGDVALAREVAEAAGRTDPFDEAACRLVMRAEYAAGEPARALTAYERLRAHLASELGADPAVATRDLHTAILRGQAVDPPPPASGELVGRDQELAVLRSAWADAASGQPRLVVVSGEAGSGKTSLLASAANQSGEALVARVACHPAERPLFLQPVVDALTQLAAAVPATIVRECAAGSAGLLAALAPTLAATLGPSTVDRTEPPRTPRWTYDAVAAFLARLSATRPLVLLIDDLHHADTTVVESLRYLHRHTDSARLLTVATVRVEESDEALRALGDVADWVELAPLSPLDVERLAGAAGRPEAATSVHFRTRGHPLFASALLLDPSCGVPDTVRSSVLDRAAWAGPETAELLRVASTMDTSFTVAQLAGLLGLPTTTVVRLCERALRGRLIRPAGAAYEFANELIRQVLYESTPTPSRAAYRQSSPGTPHGPFRLRAVPS